MQLLGLEVRERERILLTTFARKKKKTKTYILARKKKRKQDWRRNCEPKIHMELNLCLGLPGGGETTATVAGNKRGYSKTVDLKLNLNNEPETNKEGSLVSEDNTSSICPKEYPTKPPPAK